MTTDLHDPGWTPELYAAASLRIQREATRRRLAVRCRSAGALAQSIDPSIIQTPALDRIDAAIEWALSSHSARLLITAPPQEGKSNRVGVWTPIRALQRNPDTRCVLISYSESLAQESSRKARNIIEEYGGDARDPMTGLRTADKLGLALSDDKSSAGHWTLEGHAGGMYVAGIDGSVTGRPADLLIIDDPMRGMTEADSQTQRAKVIAFWESVALARLAPGAPVIIIQTRWHIGDLAGHLLTADEALPDDEKQWHWLNLPAQAVPGIPDALEREPGTWLESARGRTPADWEAKRREVGPRVWAAVYQGMPTPEGGGLFSADDFDRHRTALAGDTVVTVVSVDPAETGKRDEAGIIAASADAQGRVLWTHDRSGRMTSDRWARTAVILALEIGAGELLFEAYTTEQTYTRVFAQAYREVAEQVAAVTASAGDLAGAAAILGGHGAADIGRDLAEVAVLHRLGVPAAIDHPPYRLHPYRGKGDKVARAAGARQASSTGRLAIVGTLPVLERQATQWLLGQSSPDRMDAAVNAFERLMGLTGSESVVVSPAGARSRSVLGSMLSRQLPGSDRP